MPHDGTPRLPATRREYETAETDLAEVAYRLARGLVPYADIDQEAQRRVATRLLLAAAVRTLPGGCTDPTGPAITALHDVLKVADPVGAAAKAERCTELRRYHRDLAAQMVAIEDELVEMERAGPIAAPEGYDFETIRVWMRDLAQPDRPDAYDYDLSTFNERELMA